MILNIRIKKEEDRIRLVWDARWRPSDFPLQCPWHYFFDERVIISIVVENSLVEFPPIFSADTLVNFLQIYLQQPGILYIWPSTNSTNFLELIRKLYLSICFCQLILLWLSHFNFLVVTVLLCFCFVFKCI